MAHTEHGACIVDGRQVSTTLQCPHCGAHFDSWPGSGNRRAYCMRCAAVTCGNPDCDECIPLGARLEFSEGRKTRYDDLIYKCLAAGALLL
mgnify:CR=1 FL=1